MTAFRMLCRLLRHGVGVGPRLGRGRSRVVLRGSALLNHGQSDVATVEGDIPQQSAILMHTGTARASRQCDGVAPDQSIQGGRGSLSPALRRTLSVANLRRVDTSLGCSELSAFNPRPQDDPQSDAASKHPVASYDPGVEIELLVVPDCPNEAAASELITTAVKDTGVSATVTRTVISSQVQAEQRGFVGSPTILVDGFDPFTGSDAPAALTCRLYSTSDGVQGAPPLQDLRQALKRAAAD